MKRNDYDGKDTDEQDIEGGGLVDRDLCVLISFSQLLIHLSFLVIHRRLLSCYRT